MQPRSDLVGFVSFTIFARHVDTDARLAKKVDLCRGPRGRPRRRAASPGSLGLAFRHYLHYHIKCAKTNLHMRMRRKVRAWLQILNKAIGGVVSISADSARSWTRRSPPLDARRKRHRGTHTKTQAIMPSNIEREKKTVSGRTFTRK